MLLCSISLWMGAILKDMLPLLRGSHHAAVLRSTPPAAGRFERESIVTPRVNCYTRHREIGKTVTSLFIGWRDLSPPR